MHSESLGLNGIAERSRRCAVSNYVKFAEFGRRFLGRRLPGIGFATRRLKRPFLFEIGGRVLAFNPAVANAYCLLMAGRWNEPETHLLFKTVFDGLDEPCTFVDVGASVGEMVIDAAGYSAVTAVVAFEPQPESARAIELAAAANGFENITIVPAAVGSECGVARFVNVSDPSQSHIAAAGERHTVEVSTTTLDSTLDHVDGNVVLLIDVEGSEHNVLRGAKKLISRCRPLIIFEYNWRGKQNYTLEMLGQCLGGDYTFYRLRDDGRLDGDVHNTRNCVAVPSAGTFAQLLAPLIDVEHFAARAATTRESRSE